MSNTVRIRTTPNGSDKYLKVKLEQDFDFIEILSLKISQEDTYRKFCSDYGVIVGRVVINSGFGVPNAKVSVFIPLDDIDKNDPLISGLYPFEVITDRDSNGVRYNLLPKNGDVSNECFTPIGTLPSKREVLDNETMLNVYCKYYKFTTTTNFAGDFMIFGVPLGTYTVHVDADISDIGIASQRPYNLISQGTPTKLFYSPTKFKGDTNLDKLIQVKTLNAGVNVQPFWGDTDNCEIGITRLDFDLNYTIRPSAIFIGSIYGDQDKHSINKRCRPRRKFGELCEQITGPGSISMIRKTIDGQIENFDVEGGRVIDEDGTWAYQIPMNLDYMITDEQGNLVLSQDPNIGIPTKARVRFSIGMDETGGEGRLRTRAKYLVPNNPTNTSEVDYEFGPDTKDTSFRDLYWNKIYSVSNFISRFQKNGLTSVRTITGMKDVDACAGDKTPFPYNRVDTNLNPIFFIICLVIKIMAFLIYIMNAIIIPIINFIINVINIVFLAIINVVNTIINIANGVKKLLGFSNDIATISYSNIAFVPCISVQCPEDDKKDFAPGCKAGSKGFDASVSPPNYYDGDPFGHNGIVDYAVGLDNCIAFEMAKTLNLFKFDFYNDWVNGTLFGFLLKYKKKRKGREKFCEYDCEDFFTSGGVDGNNNGQGDNSCHNNLLVDTCFDSGINAIPTIQDPVGDLSINSHLVSRTNGGLREGLIKKVGDEFYYAATTHDTNYKLFATEVINLGSVFDCDWQGIPKIHELLIPTSYKVPPDTQELGGPLDTDVETCGMVDIGGNTGGEFFSVNCLGLHVDYRQCLNIRHICEMGVDIDQAQEDPATDVILVNADCIIGVNDIDDSGGKQFRDVFYGLNRSTTPWVGTNSLTIPSGGFSTNFNLNNIGIYNFAAGSGINGDDYATFRGYASDSSYTQPKHSYFFYFGLLPGKTSIEKMNQRFFTKCIPVTESDILLQASSTIGNPTGSITFTFIGGTGPYNYTLSGPSGNYAGTVNPSGTISGLAIGTYTITGTDSLGTPVNQTVTISGPTPLFCQVAVTKNSTNNDGKITILTVGGGAVGYTYELKSFAGAILIPAGTPVTSPLEIPLGLAVDNTGGYTVTITDNAGATCVTTGLKVTGPNPLMITTTSKTDIVCFGEATGALSVSVTGGQTPYTLNTTGPAFSSQFNSMSSLIAGTYVTTVVDALGHTASITNLLTNINAQMIVSTASGSELAKQCDPTQYFIPFYITGGASVGPVLVEYKIDTNPEVTTTMNYSGGTGLMMLNITNTITDNISIRFKNDVGGGNFCYSNKIIIQASAIERPTVLLDFTYNVDPKQCTPLKATFEISTNQLSRPPYTINYRVDGGTIQSINTSSNPTIITTPTLPISVLTGNTISPTIMVWVTDNKGCVSPAKQFVVQVPKYPLTCQITTTVIPQPPLPGFPPIPQPDKYRHVITASGGIGPYTIVNITPPVSLTPPLVPPLTLPDDYNVTISAMVVDSVGCMSPLAIG